MDTLKRKADPLSASAADLKKPKKDGSLTSFFGAPKTTSSSRSSASSSLPNGTSSVKFDKEKWVATLTEEQKSLLKLEINTLDPSWLAQLKDEIKSSSFLELKRFLKRELDQGKKIFPPMEDVYSWSRHTPLPRVKAVILGQDPYHNDHQAHGLCFSVRPPTKPPPSLKNVYIALARDFPSFRPPPPPNTGLLTPWADAGVLLLNTCLTVQAHQAASHAGKGWEKFTEAVIDIVAKQSKGVVFLAWGSPALKRTAKVDKKKHLVLSSVHPSPLSANRGFFDCGHFKKCNEWLEGRYGVGGGVDWTLDPKAKAEPAVAANGKAKDTARENVAQINDTVAEATHDIATALAKKQDDFDADEDEDAIEALAAIVDMDEKVETKANGHGVSDKAKAEDVGATMEGEEAEEEAVKE